MLHEMRSRGPDSAGFAVYDEGTPGHHVSITVLAEAIDVVDWTATAADLELVSRSTAVKVT